MRIIIDEVENGWTVETVQSPEMPTRTVRVAHTRKDLISILEVVIYLEGTPP